MWHSDHQDRSSDGVSLLRKNAQRTKLHRSPAADDSKARQQKAQPKAPGREADDGRLAAVAAGSARCQGTKSRQDAMTSPPSQLFDWTLELHNVVRVAARYS